MRETFTNRSDPEEMRQNVATCQDLCCLPQYVNTLEDEPMDRINLMYFVLNPQKGLPNTIHAKIVFSAYALYTSCQVSIRDIIIPISVLMGSQMRFCVYDSYAS